MNILVIQTAYLGDCVLTLPLINSLKKSFEGKISVLTRPETSDIFRSAGAVDDVISFDKRGIDRGVWSLFKIAGSIRRMDFDMVFLPQRSIRSGLISFLSGIPRRIGFKRGGANIFLTDKVEYDWNIHEAERLLSLAPVSGGNNITRESSLAPDPEIVDSYNKKYLDTEKKIIGICPQSEWYTKCWPIERYEELIRTLGNDMQLIILGNKKQEWLFPNTIDLTGKTSIKELIAIVSQLDLLVSNDSGVMHIAAAVKVPVVSIFGPTVPGMGFAPFGAGHTVIDIELDCRPCGLHGGTKCPRKHFKCMLDITTKRVTQEVYAKIGC
ncbi:MAG: lipopolysaccharide heptosyltransferase II [Elusimicrobiota bacterium]